MNMKRLLWLVPPSEAWLASNLAPRLEPGLRSAGFNLKAPIPPKEPRLARLLIHYARLMFHQGDIVHAFDGLSAIAGLTFRRAKERVVVDGGIAGRPIGGWRIPGLKTVFWGSGGDLPWPTRHKPVWDGRNGNMIGFDSGKTANKMAQSVVWAFEITRQVAPRLKLSLGEGIRRIELQQFAQAVGARMAIGEDSCERALDEQQMQGLLLAHPNRRVIDLAARALAFGCRVAWVQEKGYPLGGLPSTDAPVDWSDRPGLARLFLRWGDGPSPHHIEDKWGSDMQDLVRNLARVYEDSGR